MKRFPYALCVAFSIALIVLAGCNSDPRAKVSGTVTFKDKALTGGTVVFVSEDGVRQERVTIGKDGSYSSTHVPVGNCKVGVEPAAKGLKASMPKGEKRPTIPEDSPAAKAYESTGDYVNIPQTLRDPATSQMTFKVEPGEQSFNITLKDVDGKGPGSGKGSSKGF